MEFYRQITVRLLVNPDEIGPIMGEKGDTVKAIRVKTGTSIFVCKKAGHHTPRVVTIHGCINNILNAISIIIGVLKTDNITILDDERNINDRLIKFQWDIRCWGSVMHISSNTLTNSTEKFCNISPINKNDKQGLLKGISFVLVALFFGITKRYPIRVPFHESYASDYINNINNNNNSDDIKNDNTITPDTLAQRNNDPKINILKGTKDIETILKQEYRNNQIHVLCISDENEWKKMLNIIECNNMTLNKDKTLATTNFTTISDDNKDDEKDVTIDNAMESKFVVDNNNDNNNNGNNNSNNTEYIKNNNNKNSNNINSNDNNNGNNRKSITDTNNSNDNNNDNNNSNNRNSITDDITSDSNDINNNNNTTDKPYTYPDRISTPYNVDLSNKPNKFWANQIGFHKVSPHESANVEMENKTDFEQISQRTMQDHQIAAQNEAPQAIKNAHLSLNNNTHNQQPEPNPKNATNNISGI